MNLSRLFYKWRPCFIFTKSHKGGGGGYNSSGKVIHLFLKSLKLKSLSTGKMGNVSFITSIYFYFAHAVECYKKVEHFS